MCRPDGRCNSPAIASMVDSVEGKSWFGYVRHVDSGPRRPIVFRSCLLGLPPAAMFSRCRARPTLSPIFLTTRSSSNLYPLSHSILLRTRGVGSPKHADVKTALSAHGTVTRLYQMLPLDPWSFIVTFESEEVAKKLLERGTLLESFRYVKPVTKRRKALPRLWPRGDGVKNTTVILRRVPVKFGCTTEDVGALVKTFGSASILHRTFPPPGRAAALTSISQPTTGSIHWTPPSPR